MADVLGTLVVVVVEQLAVGTLPPEIAPHDMDTHRHTSWKAIYSMGRHEHSMSSRQLSHTCCHIHYWYFFTSRSHGVRLCVCCGPFWVSSSLRPDTRTWALVSKFLDRHAFRFLHFSPFHFIYFFIKFYRSQWIRHFTEEKNQFRQKSVDDKIERDNIFSVILCSQKRLTHKDQYSDALEQVSGR